MIMEKLIMNNKSFSLFIFLILLSAFSCSGKDKYVIPTDLMPVKKFITLDVCGCNKQARIILDQSIELIINSKILSIFLASPLEIWINISVSFSFRNRILNFQFELIQKSFCLAML